MLKKNIRYTKYSSFIQPLINLKRERDTKSIVPLIILTIFNKPQIINAHKSLSNLTSIVSCTVTVTGNAVLHGNLYRDH